MTLTKNRSTIMRKRLAHIIATDKVRNAKTALIKAGYAETTAGAKSKEIMHSKQVEAELLKVGFTPEHAKARIASIMNAPIVSEMITPDNQLRASELALKVFGSFHDNEGSRTLNINVFSPEQAKAIAERILNPKQ